MTGNAADFKMQTLLLMLPQMLLIFKQKAFKNLAARQFWFQPKLKKLCAVNSFAFITIFFENKQTMLKLFLMTYLIYGHLPCIILRS